MKRLRESWAPGGKRHLAFLGMQESVSLRSNHD
jgi:hypothetical protein